jgi:glycosyltransferase involved in cell wall biosynthesis
MDVFVQPSLRDSLPNALLEAMACGRAEIGTSASGIPDAVTDCENGRLVSTNNAEELARAMEELFMDKNLRMRFGNTACQTIADRFTLRGNLAVYRRSGLKL